MEGYLKYSTPGLRPKFSVGQKVLIIGCNLRPCSLCDKKYKCRFTTRTWTGFGYQRTVSGPYKARVMSISNIEDVYGGDYVRQINKDTNYWIAMRRYSVRRQGAQSSHWLNEIELEGLKFNNHILKLKGKSWQESAKNP